jgi:hypothetical protein
VLLPAELLLLPLQVLPWELLLSLSPLSLDEEDVSDAWVGDRTTLAAAAGSIGGRSSSSSGDRR